MRANASRTILFIIFQDLLLIGCLALAANLRYIYDVYPVFTLNRLAGLGLTFLTLKLCFHYFDLYEIAIHISFREFFSSMLKAFIAATLILTVLHWQYPHLKGGDYVWAVTVPVGVSATIGFRLLWNAFSNESSFTQRVLVLGTGRTAQAVLEDMLRYSHSGYEVVGVASEEPTDREDVLGFPILGHGRDLASIHRKRPMDTIIVALTDQRGSLPVEELMELKFAGVTVIDSVTFHEAFSGKIVLESLRPSWFVFTDGFKVSRLRLLIKRAFDLGSAALGLASTLPLAIIVAALVKLTSRGPLLYRQERVGWGGATFQLLKFRTMQTDAEARSGPVWAAENDSRVTRIGRYLRRFRIDEIPQMWNVLKGEMSFVGPRPERPFFVKQLAGVLPYYNQRHVVKPGITGWAQVRYPYGASVEDAREKLQLDLYYIKHTNLGFDVKILVTTIRVLFTKMAR